MSINRVITGKNLPENFNVVIEITSESDNIN